MSEKKLYPSLPKLTEDQKLEVEKNIGLVSYVAEYVAKKLPNGDMRIDDMVQDGIFGLMKAVHAYDKTFGTRFSTYAFWWIKQSIMRGIAGNCRSLSIPIYRQDQFRKYLKLSSKNNTEWENLTDEELKFVNEFDLTKFFGVMKKDISLDATVESHSKPGSGSRELGELIADNSIPDSSDLLSRIDLSKQLNGVLRTLTPREAKVIKLRFGLDDGETKTLEDVSKIIDRTTERVRQIEKIAIHKLRHPSRSKKLKEFYV